jgi:hypothetical protein
MTDHPMLATRPWEYGNVNSGWCERAKSRGNETDSQPSMTKLHSKMSRRNAAVMNTPMLMRRSTLAMARAAPTCPANMIDDFPGGPAALTNF